MQRRPCAGQNSTKAQPEARLKTPDGTPHLRRRPAPAPHSTASAPYSSASDPYGSCLLYGNTRRRVSTNAVTASIPRRSEWPPALFAPDAGRFSPSLRGVGGSRNLIYGKALLVPQDYGVAVLGPNALQGVLECPTELLSFRISLRRRLRILAGRSGVAAGLQLVERDGRDAPAAEMVDNDVPEDLEEPGRKSTLGIVGLQPCEGPDECVLSEILSERAVADEPRGDVDSGRGIPGDKRPIRLLRAGERLTSQFAVAGGHG